MNRAGWLQRLCKGVLGWRYPLVLIGIATVLALPSLWGGLQLDDYTIRSSVLDSRLWGGQHAGPWEPFTFLDGDPELNHLLMDQGILPWWTDPECRAAFWRPLTALTHIVDYHGWPDWPAVMHLQSLIWFALLIWAAAVLYRRLIGRTYPASVAVLAALLFTLDDSHGAPVGWLANRNTVISGFFGILTLIAFDRWRRDGWRPGAVLAPAALLAGLLAKESAVCVGAYLLAYAIFIDRGGWRSRLTALWPCLLTGLAWYTVYKLQGFGVSRSGLYVDPFHDPAGFLRHVADYAPLLLLGQWGLPPSEFHRVAAAPLAHIHWLASVIFLLPLGILLGPLLARNSLARFWGLAMVLSLLPACLAFPGDRMLMFVGLGAMGLLAQLLAGLKRRDAWLPSIALWRWPAKVIAVVLVGIHLVIAPLAFPFMATGMKRMNERADKLADTLPDNPAFGGQTAVFVNLPTWGLNLTLLQIRHYQRRPIPARVLSLGAACTDASFGRPNATTLVVRPRGGYLAAQYGAKKHDPVQPAVSMSNALRSLDILFRGREFSLKLGDRVELTAVTVEITDMTEDGRPAEATFHFRVPLEDSSLRWLQIRRGEGFVDFTLPKIGETVQVESLIK